MKHYLWAPAAILLLVGASTGASATHDPTHVALDLGDQLDAALAQAPPLPASVADVLRSVDMAGDLAGGIDRCAETPSEAGESRTVCISVRTAQDVDSQVVEFPPRVEQNTLDATADPGGDSAKLSWTFYVGYGWFRSCYRVTVSFK